MKRDRRRFLLLSGAVLLPPVPRAGHAAPRRRARAKQPAPEPPAPPLPEGVLARLDFGSGADLPAGAEALAGQWTIDAATKTLRAAPTPLLDGWLEFGPEIREKGAAIVASGRAPGDSIQSRIGVGLYGKNGFQLRLVPAQGHVELVRRGAVLLRRPFAGDPAQLHWMRLAVRGSEGLWIVTGRVWRDSGEDLGEGGDVGPGEDDTGPDLFEHAFPAEDLQFPLAGRSVLFATPFSGEPVAFASAEVFREGDPRGEL